MHSITQVLMDGANEGRCRKLRKFKQEGDQVRHMHKLPDCAPVLNPPHRQKMANAYMLAAVAEKNARHAQ